MCTQRSSPQTFSQDENDWEENPLLLYTNNETFLKNNTKLKFLSEIEGYLPKIFFFFRPIYATQLGYDRIVLRRSRNRNRIFHYIIPVLSTGTGICQYKSGSGRTGTGFFRIQSGSGKNRILRSDRNSGRNRNLTNAIPARTGIAENVKTDLFVDLRVFL